MLLGRRSTRRRRSVHSALSPVRRSSSVWRPARRVDMFVDPAVSLAKFEREVSGMRAAATAYHGKGIWLLEATYPEVFVVFVARHAKPAPYVMFGAVIDFTDYDVVPLSVHLVNAFTR